MKNTYKYLLYFISLLIVLITVSCGDDEETSTYLERRPTITDISVADGLRGAEVVLNGINFESVNQVKFGSVEAEFSKTATSISTKVPDEVEIGELNIAIYGSNGSDRIAFVAVVEPVITEVSHYEALPGTEIAISGENLNWVNVVTLGGVSVAFKATDKEILISIPVVTVYGEVAIVVSTRGGTDMALINILDQPVIASVSSMNGEAGKEITVEGINFVDVESVKIGETETGFEVNGATSLTFTVPEGASNGVITITTATGAVNTEEEFAVIIITGESPRTSIYEEEYIAGWEVWGWGNTNDFANKEKPLNGNNAIKVSYEGTWGGFSLHPVPVFDLTGYKTITLSIFGSVGTGGDVQLYIKDEAGGTFGPTALDVIEGQYTTFTVTLSDIGNPSNMNELVLQDMGTENNVIYVDAIILQ